MYNRAALRYTGYNEKEDADGSAPSKTKNKSETMLHKEDCVRICTIWWTWRDSNP